MTRTAGGFTFVEILAALMFLAILVPAVVGGLSLSNRLSVFSERSAVANELAENKMNEMLLDDAWASSGATRGDFGAEWPGYRWEMNQTGWKGDTSNPMTELSMEVFFPVQGKEHNVRLATLVTGSETLQPETATQ